MASPESLSKRIVPREVAVRPVRDAQERRRWDALVSEFHYLAFRALFGQSLRHVAVHGSVWVALVGWTAGAFKVGGRDRWVGWAPARQFRRVGLVANNSRFVVLTGEGEAGNLASRVLGLSLRRLSRDMCAAYGKRMLVAAVEHGSGLVLGQVRVGEKRGEIPAARAVPTTGPGRARRHARRPARPAGTA